MSLKKSSSISNSTPNELAKKTESAPKTLLVIVSTAVGVIAVAVIIAVLALRPRTVALTLGTAHLSVVVADTVDLRTQGLSDSASLPADQGMLFVFPSDAPWRFWMKDMHYSLDIIWLDANKKVVSIAADATPGSYPQKVFAPSGPVRYALEVNAGVAAKSNITVGEKAAFTLP